MNAEQQAEFIKIVEQHQGVVNNLCRLYYPNLEDQKDARQDIVLQLWKSFPNFKGDATISTWIYRVSLNTILTKIRNQKRRVPLTTLEVCAEQKIPLPIGTDDYVQLLRSCSKTY